MLRALLRWKWIHAVSFVLLGLMTAGDVGGLLEAFAPDAPVDVTVDNLFGNPPIGKRVRITCDAVVPFYEVTKGHTTDKVIAMCTLGKFFLPVTLGPDDRIPANVVEGTLFNVSGNELWMKKGVGKDSVIGGRNLDVYVDATVRDLKLIAFGMTAGTIVLWIWWVIAFLRRKRRRAFEAAKVEQTFFAPPKPVPRAHPKVQFAAALCEISAAGLDARREDGTSTLVRWADIIGIVARRLPGELGGDTFVDIMSAPGATLRILPWTRITGDAATEPRLLVQSFAARCSSAQLDAATSAFVDGEPALQLPDAAMLAEHDRRVE